MPSRKTVTARFGDGGSVILDDPEAFKVLYEPLRFRIVKLLGEPLSAKDLADRLDKPLTSLYYHLNLLADHGLIKVDEERVSGRTVERIFRRAADAFAASGEVAEIVDGLADEDSELASAMRHLRKAMGPTHNQSVRITMDMKLQLNPEQAKTLARRIRKTIDAYADEIEGDEEARPFRVLVALGDADGGSVQSFKKVRRHG
jgi:DNA-binding transcriptional ArsR family regulator